MGELSVGGGGLPQLPVYPEVGDISRLGEMGMWAVSFLQAALASARCFFRNMEINVLHTTRLACGLLLPETFGDVSALGGRRGGRNYFSAYRVQDN